MTEMDKAVARVRDFLVSSKMSKSGLAKEAGMSPNALRDLDRDDWNPTRETLDKLLATISDIKAKRKSRPSAAQQRAAAA